jgi:hypothetical protein
MTKLIGLTFLALLIGTSVVAWSRSTGPETRAVHPSQSAGFSPDMMHLTIKSLPVQKVHDMSVVFTDND